MSGRLLWRVNLGTNVRSGSHYDSFQVFDHDRHGKAEMAPGPPTDRRTRPAPSSATGTPRISKATARSSAVPSTCPCAVPPARFRYRGT
ncbi:hypothetical protein ACIOEW_31595 [Streptomyces sp. NPDC087901]|uniref:rhamnogalacturonan lyase family protein n=1 Tax=Streptomyces sp. NPDC087901 TaxID=3365818 RepID=UPI003805A645